MPFFDAVPIFESFFFTFCSRTYFDRNFKKYHQKIIGSVINNCCFFTPTGVVQIEDNLMKKNENLAKI